MNCRARCTGRDWVTQVAPPSLVAAKAVAMAGSPIWLLIAAQQCSWSEQEMAPALGRSLDAIVQIESGCCPRRQVAPPSWLYQAPQLPRAIVSEPLPLTDWLLSRVIS